MGDKEAVQSKCTDGVEATGNGASSFLSSVGHMVGFRLSIWCLSRSEDCIIIVAAYILGCGRKTQPVVGSLENRSDVP